MSAITIRKLSSGYWHIRGVGPCNWAQPKYWPCIEVHLRETAFPQASENFIRDVIKIGSSVYVAGEREP